MTVSARNASISKSHYCYEPFVLYSKTGMRYLCLGSKWGFPQLSPIHWLILPFTTMHMPKLRYDVSVRIFTRNIYTAGHARNPNKYLIFTNILRPVSCHQILRLSTWIAVNFADFYKIISLPLAFSLVKALDFSSIFFFCTHILTV